MNRNGNQACASGREKDGEQDPKHDAVFGEVRCRKKKEESVGTERHAIEPVLAVEVWISLRCLADTRTQDGFGADAENDVD